MTLQATVVFCVFSLAHREGCATWPPCAAVSLRLIGCATWLSKFKCTYVSSCRNREPEHGIKASSLRGSVYLQDRTACHKHIGCPTVLQLICCKSTLATLVAWHYWQWLQNQSWLSISVENFFCLKGKQPQRQGYWSTYQTFGHGRLVAGR